MPKLVILSRHRLMKKGEVMMSSGDRLTEDKDTWSLPVVHVYKDEFELTELIYDAATNVEEVAIWKLGDPDNIKSLVLMENE